MKKIFGAKKSKEPTPTIQDATNQVSPPPLPFSLSTNRFPPSNPNASLF
jgi:hypothetical protein